MTTFIIAFAVFVLALLGLSLGVLLHRRPIKGSCGGLNRIDGLESDCGGACQGHGSNKDAYCPRRATKVRTEREADRRTPL